MSGACSRRSFLGASGAALAIGSLGAGSLRAAGADASTGLDWLARKKGLRFGSAVDPRDLTDPALAQLLEAECSVLVGENAFKWKVLEPQARRYNFGPADQIYDWTVARGKALRGHTFVWNQDNRIPEWIARVEEEPAALRVAVLETLMREHIENVMGRYPAITSWDVVNEMIQLGDGSIRSSVWSRALGERIMDSAFAIARETDPKCQLVYNDYMSWGTKPDHRDGVLRLLESSLGRGVPIDALGIQGHLATTLGKEIDIPEWRRFLDEVQGMGLKVLITELDCADAFVASSDPRVRDQAAAEHVKEFLDVTLSYENVTEILLWDLTDSDSYVRSKRYEEKRGREDKLPMRAHPFDENLQRKPMYGAIAAALRSAPKRKVS